MDNENVSNNLDWVPYQSIDDFKILIYVLKYIIKLIYHNKIVTLQNRNLTQAYTCLHVKNLATHFL